MQLFFFPGFYNLEIKYEVVVLGDEVWVETRPRFCEKPRHSTEGTTPAWTTVANATVAQRILEMKCTRKMSGIHTMKRERRPFLLSFTTPFVFGETREEWARSRVSILVHLAGLIFAMSV